MAIDMKNCPDPQRWAIEIFQLEKRFRVRQGLPMDWEFGSAHWLISSLIKGNKESQWCRAVDGVDLKIPRGELLGLLGPNGAGKTTLIKCLATLLEIDGGEAFVNGFSVKKQPDQVRLSMNLVGSGHWMSFDWGMTVTQNLHFFGSLYGLNKSTRRQRIEQTLSLLKMSHLAKRTPVDLSSGERQRMLLAKGFMIRTPICFLDEPTVGLDPGGARDVREFIQKELMGKSGVSGILTTHRMSEAEAICSKIAIMDRGRIAAFGTPLELEQLAGQSSVLEVRATSIPQEAIDAIRQMRGVRAVALAPAGEESIEESLRVHCEDANAIADQIASVAKSKGAQINSVEVQKPTLEDAFIALTNRRLT